VPTDGRASSGRRKRASAQSHNLNWFIGFGLVLIVVGAILKFAVTADANGFDTRPRA
jgi:hypothetical protein